MRSTGEENRPLGQEGCTQSENLSMSMSLYVHGFVLSTDNRWDEKVDPRSRMALSYSGTKGSVPQYSQLADGFTPGRTTDWESESCETGDAFVIAPDGSRAGLVWEVYDPPYFQEVRPIETGSWGVWGVGFCLPMNSRARRDLESILPELKLRRAEWKSRFSP
jgi:hypothetical protein